MIHIYDKETKQMALTQSMSNLSRSHGNARYARYEQYKPAKLEHAPRGEGNTTGHLYLNPPQNSYLPLDYDPKWVEGGCLCAHHGTTSA